MAEDDRRRMLDAPGFLPVMRETLLQALYASGADLVIVPVQDVFGWRERINQPATVGSENWTWRLPWPSDRLTTEPDAIAGADRLKQWAERHRRI
jgi:4-alpha-glucanotransferase